MVLGTKSKWKENNNLIVYHQNIRSLNKKRDEISIMLQEIKEKPHLICLSEHHIRKVESLDLTLPDYKLANIYCREINLKGGVCILARNDMIYQSIDLTKQCKEKTFEISAVKLNTGYFKVIVCCVYRSPSETPNDFLKHLEKTLKLLYQPTISLVICGDFNINFLIENPTKQKLESLMKTFNLMQVVNFPTRICNNKGTLIDSIFLDKGKFNNISVHPFENGLSDHVAQFLILGNIEVPLQKHKSTKKTRRTDKDSIDKFQSCLSEEAWDAVYNSDNANRMFNNFHCILLRHFESSFPIQYTTYRNKHNDWITKGIIISCKRKRNLYTLYKHSNNPQVKEHYKKYCSILRKVIIEAKKLHYNKHIEHSSNRVKTTWKIIKDLTGKTKTSDINIEIDTAAGKLININDIAKAFNTYFTNIAENLTNKLTDVNMAMSSLKETYPESIAEMKIIPVTESEVINVIKSLKNKDSSGYDGISNNILKFCVKDISKPLTSIFNLSLETGVFPDRFKYAIVQPIHKKGDKTKLTNYRPISLLISCSKILETIMFNRLYQYVYTNGILAPEQFGFRKGTRIEKAIFTLTNSILSSMNLRHQIGGIFCDLSKAFDCINHDILLAKLHYYGIRGMTLNWFKSYITSRRQRVKIKSQNHKQDSWCKWEIIKYGVPQGSILGPLLFIIYVNDLPYSINQFARPVLYADDTSILVTAKNLEDLHIKIDHIIHHITEWFAINGLTLNMEKTKIIKFCANYSQNNLLQNPPVNNTITEVTNTKFLGLELDNNMNWKKHVLKILPKLSRACYAVRVMYPFSSLSTLKMIYYAYFHTRIQYGIIFWGNSTESKKVFLAQKEVIRIMTGSGRRASCKSLFQELGILTIASQYILSLMEFLLQNREMFASNIEIHSINTRNNLKLHKPISNLTICQRGVYNMCIRIFNKLPTHIANLVGSKRTFIFTLRKYLVDKSLYSVEEFFNE